MIRRRLLPTLAILSILVEPSSAEMAKSVNHRPRSLCQDNLAAMSDLDEREPPGFGMIADSGDEPKKFEPTWFRRVLEKLRRKRHEASNPEFDERTRLLLTTEETLADMVSQLHGYFDDRPALLQTKELRRRRPKSDLKFSRRDLKRAMGRAHASNLSLEVLLSASRARKLSTDQALHSARQIVDALRRAGAAARSGDLRLAVETLSDPNVLFGTTFFLSPLRVPISTEKSLPLGDLAFQRANLEKWKWLPVEPSVDFSSGAVVIPEIPMAANAEMLRVARALWLRVSAEELAHVAQALLARATPGDRFLSEMMKSERSVVRSLVAMDVERLNEKKPKFLGQRIPTFYNLEADVYAFLIETFGPELIPSWCGIESGYEIRRLIDEELTSRGVPHRAWPPP